VAARALPPKTPQLRIADKDFERDAHFQRLRELRNLSGLGKVPAAVAMPALKNSAVGGFHTVESFSVALKNLKLSMPEKISREIFNLFDKDGNGKVDFMEIVTGVTVFCSGSEAEKLHSTFCTIDNNGDGFISYLEMVKFLHSVFRVVLSPSLTASMRSMGVQVEDAEDLAQATAEECFRTADLNADGRISFPEFKKWFESPNRIPTFASLP
jgi:Ca2+-binding EF-hand superfamily protein